MKSLFEIAAAICALAFAVSRVFYQDPGGVIFSSLGAFFLFLHATLRDPNAVALSILRGFRRFFQNGSQKARMLMMAIGVGGTFLVIDGIYEIHFIWNWLDPTIKRLALPLVLTTVVFYGASIVAAVIHNAAERRADPSLRRFEFLYYLSGSVLIIAFTAFMIGAPVEILMAPKDAFGHPDLTDIVPYFVWPLEVFKGLAAAALVALVWLVAFFLCIVSRQAEWFFLKPKPSPPTPGLVASAPSETATVKPRGRIKTGA